MCIATCAGFFVCLCVCVCVCVNFDYIIACGVWVSHIHVCDRFFGKTDQLARNFYCFVAFFVERRYVPLSKFEGYLMLTFGGRRASFLLASSSLNEYFRAYTIIDFLANRLVFVNMVTYVPHPLRGLSTPTSMECPEICPSPSPPPPQKNKTTTTKKNIKKQKQQIMNNGLILCMYFLYKYFRIGHRVYLVFGLSLVRPQSMCVGRVSYRGGGGALEYSPSS